MPFTLELPAGNVFSLCIYEKKHLQLKTNLHCHLQGKAQNAGVSMPGH